MPSGNFSPWNTTLPWLPSNADYAKNNVQRQAESIARLSQLIAFRRNHFVSSSVAKHGNYLFHYIHGGEIVLERYFNYARNNAPADDSSNEVPAVQRARYVLFANLGKEVKVKDMRDKFHLGTIKVTTNAKRMRDFLYFKSLKLDPGEAIIAQVE